MIEGVNVDDENITETAKFVFDYIKELKVELLPYYFVGFEKCKALKIESPSNGEVLELITFE